MSSVAVNADELLLLRASEVPDRRAFPARKKLVSISRATIMSERNRADSLRRRMGVTAPRNDLGTNSPSTPHLRRDEPQINRAGAE